MIKTMNPSRRLTKKQINKATDEFRHWLSKQAPSVSAETFQDAILEKGVWIAEVARVVSNHLSAQEVLRHHENLAIKTLHRSVDALEVHENLKWTHNDVIDAGMQYDLESSNVVAYGGVGNDDIVEIALGRKPGINGWNCASYSFPPKVVGPILRALVEAQKNGADGPLLMEGQRNVFYTTTSEILLSRIGNINDSKKIWYACSNTRVRAPEWHRYHLNGARVFRFIRGAKFVE